MQQLREDLSDNIAVLYQDRGDTEAGDWHPLPLESCICGECLQTGAVQLAAYFQNNCLTSPQDWR